MQKRFTSQSKWLTICWNRKSPSPEFFRRVERRVGMARVNELHVNGKAVRIDADGERSLLSVLRDDLDLTGAKYGCGEGECGACTVLIDGAPRRSCRTTIGEVGQRKITTIESLEKDGKLHPIQEAFLKEDAMQCAY